MGKQKLLFIVWGYLILCILIGGLLGIFLIGRETGEYNFTGLAPSVFGGLAAGSLLSFFLYKWNKRRNGNVPDIDERSILLMKRYLLIVLYVVLFGSGLALIILYALGVQTIETGMLIACLACLYIVIGIGAVIVKRM